MTPPLPVGIWAGALALLLVYQETGCPHSARNAARLLALIAEDEAVDSDTRALAERASARLGTARAGTA